MSRANLITEAFHDLSDDIADRAVRLAHGTFDLICLTALGLVVYASTIGAADAGLHGRPIFGVQAAIEGAAGVAVTASHAPTSCGLTNDLLASAHRDCITALVLQPMGA